jgi:hypothetical protein
MQDGATAHTANYSINAFDHEFENKLITCRLWPARTPHLNPGDSDLCGKLENKVYSNNLQTLDKLKHKHM